jgi:hypothetical protein
MDDRVVLPVQEYPDCEREDWVLKPKTPGDYLAQTSCWFGRIACVILALQLLLWFASSILGFLLLHFSILYAVPGTICVLAGGMALLLPSSQQKAKRKRALQGIAFGAILFAWLVFRWVYLAPAMSQAL